MIDLSDIPPIDWTAVRHRVRAAGIFLGASDHAEKIAAQTDDQLNEDMAFINFGRTYEISLDWLVTGEGLPMLDPERTRRHPRNEIEAEQKPSGIATLFAEWQSAVRQLAASTSEEEYSQAYEVRCAVLDRIAEAEPATILDMAMKIVATISAEDDVNSCWAEATVRQSHAILGLPAPFSCSGDAV